MAHFLKEQYDRLFKRPLLEFGMGETDFELISPDGFSITREPITTSGDIKQAVIEAFEDFKSRFEAQGYYSSNRGKIALEDLGDFTKVFIHDNEATSPMDVRSRNLPTVSEFI